jgi:hypothetical protein
VTRIDWAKNKRQRERHQRNHPKPSVRLRPGPKGAQPPTDKQLSYINWLAQKVEREAPVPANRLDARNIITQLRQQLDLRKKGGGANSNRLS